MKNSKKKQVILTLIAVLSLVVITVGVSYSLFTYSKIGVTDNIVKTGKINFLYTELSGIGKGISLTDSFPISDEEGKIQTGEGKVFDFKITSTIEMNSNIKYEVTARKKSDSTLSEDKVKLYLTEVDGVEKELLLDKYYNLEQTSTKVPEGVVEKTIYEATVPANTTSYEKNFRLRMWIDNDADFSDGDMSNKTFTITVNVYANGKVVTIPENTVYTFDYTGKEQTFVVPVTGKYKIETWGAQGADATDTYIGGYGGYSSGNIMLNKGTVLYINVGGIGNKYEYAYNKSALADGGYNGGGYGHVNVSEAGWTYRYLFAGGGATHISLKSGLLSSLKNEQANILIVSGGGGSGSAQVYSGSLHSYTIGGSGGGFIGNSMILVSRLWTCGVENSNSFYGTGGTQNNGGKFSSCNSFSYAYDGLFGQASLSKFSLTDKMAVWGGGGGYFGGTVGAGGSGYIGNTLLYNKVMYCYNCQESKEESTKTISTTCTSETPEENCSKQKNGYARITYLEN